LASSFTSFNGLPLKGWLEDEEEELEDCEDCKVSAMVKSMELLYISLDVTLDEDVLRFSDPFFNEEETSVELAEYFIILFTWGDMTFN
jgi:hypothetical protein